MAILVFGALGTECHVDGRRYEIVSLSDGVTTYRGKCEACHERIFVETKAGGLPTTKRCSAHAGKRVAVDAAVEASDAARAEIAARYGNGVMAESAFVPPRAIHRPEEKLASPADVSERRVPRHEDTATVLQAAEAEARRRYHEEIARKELAEAERRVAALRADLGAEYTNGPSSVHLEEPVDDATWKPPAFEIEPRQYDAEPELRPQPVAARMTEPPEVWVDRLNLWAGHQMWMKEWGPRPGQDGCRAPRDMMRGRRIPERSGLA